MLLNAATRRTFFAARNSALAAPPRVRSRVAFGEQASAFLATPEILVVARPTEPTALFGSDWTRAQKASKRPWERPLVRPDDSNQPRLPRHAEHEMRPSDLGAHRSHSKCTASSHAAGREAGPPQPSQAGATNRRVAQSYSTSTVRDAFRRRSSSESR
jgi:hypothetical protein